MLGRVTTHAPYHYRRDPVCAAARVTMTASQKGHVIDTNQQGLDEFFFFFGQDTRPSSTSPDVKAITPDPERDGQSAASGPRRAHRYSTALRFPCTIQETWPQCVVTLVGTPAITLKYNGKTWQDLARPGNPLGVSIRSALCFNQ